MPRRLSVGDIARDVTMREGGFLRTSEPCGDLYGALAKAQSAFLPIKRTKVNPYYHSKYADLADVIAATQAALSANGLCVIQGAGTDTDARVVYISTRLAHASGQWVEHVVALPGTMRAEKGQPERFDSQSVGAAITYGRRYGRSAILGVASDEDDDGNAAVSGPEGDGASRPAQDARPPLITCPKCGQPGVIRSKFPPKDGGPSGWYCLKCKAQYPFDAIKDRPWDAAEKETAEAELLDANAAPIETPEHVASQVDKAERARQLFDAGGKSTVRDKAAQTKAAKAFVEATKSDEAEARDLF